MNDALFSFCANVFGFITGGISLLGFVAAVCRPHLPSKKIERLDTLLCETETTFKTAVEAGLLLPDFVRRTEQRLVVLKERTRTYRDRVYSATTLSHDYTEFLRGTSTAIGRVCHSVKKLRAEVITSSQERHHGSEQTQTPSALPSNPVTRHDPTPTPSAPPSSHVTQPASTPPPIVRRSNSCPPTLPAQQSNHMRNVPIGIDGSTGRVKMIDGNCPQGSDSPPDPSQLPK